MKCWVLLLAVVALVAAQTAPMSCEYTDGAGNTFDLSPLTYDPSQNSPTGYNAMDSSSQNYYINFCQQVSTVDTNTAPCNKAAPAAVCQSSGGNYHSAGAVSTQTWGPWSNTNAPATEGNFTSGLALVYSNGDACPGLGSSVYRRTTINVACNEDTEKGGAYGAYSTSGSCDYQVFYSSSLACIGGGSGGGSGGVNPGWVIIFIVCIFFFVYVAVGMAIKFAKFEARGLDLVPNYDFWKDVPALFKGGIIFFIQKITFGKVCGGYTEI